MVLQLQGLSAGLPIKTSTLRVIVGEHRRHGWLSHRVHRTPWGTLPNHYYLALNLASHSNNSDLGGCELHFLHLAHY